MLRESHLNTSFKAGAVFTLCRDPCEVKGPGPLLEKKHYRFQDGGNSALNRPRGRLRRWRGTSPGAPWRLCHRGRDPHLLGAAAQQQRGLPCSRTGALLLGRPLSDPSSGPHRPLGSFPHPFPLSPQVLLFPRPPSRDRALTGQLIGRPAWGVWYFPQQLGLRWLVPVSSSSAVAGKGVVRSKA